MGNICELCGMPIFSDQATVMHDDELCHIDCAANDMDEAGFYDERDND